ncbi:MAG: GtrA family protein [Betaproteobacteria bacterium]
MTRPRTEARGLGRALHALAHRPLLQLAASFTAHVATGFLAVGVHYGILWLLLRGGVDAVAGSAVGFVGGAVTRFLLAYHHVFTPSHSLGVAGRRFLVALLAQFVANMALLAALLAAGATVWPAQVTTTILLTFANYAAYRWWVFR